MTGEPVPRLVWGQPKTGLEDVSLSDVASIINSPAVANNQVQWILKQYWSSIPEPDWKMEAQIAKDKNPFPTQPFGVSGGGQGQGDKSREVPVEVLVERLNNLDMVLQVIEENHRHGKIELTKASRLADDAILVHMKRSYPEGWEAKRTEKFQWFIQKLVKGGGKQSYTVIPDS